jgi:hypothetical protein
MSQYNSLHWKIYIILLLIFSYLQNSRNICHHLYIDKFLFESYFSKMFLKLLLQIYNKLSLIHEISLAKIILHILKRYFKIDLFHEEVHLKTVLHILMHLKILQYLDPVANFDTNLLHRIIFLLIPHNH